MPVLIERAVEELKEVLQEAQNALDAQRRSDDDLLTSISSLRVGGRDRSSEAIALSRSAIERYTPRDSAYRRQVDVATRGKGSQTAIAADMLGILAALIRDYEAGRLRTFEELIHSDLSADFLTQAENLLSASYKDAAAVIAGTVLEQHLRLLAERGEISIFSGGRHKKADQLNADLAKAAAYRKTEQKLVTAWLGRRNDAAHGDYNTYTAGDVRLMIDGIGSFVSRFPA
jgi:hypothetical protein